MTTHMEAFDIGNSFQHATDSIVGYLPKLLAFLIILIVGYVIARVIKVVLNKILDRLRVDERLHSGKAGEFVARVSPGGKPSHLIGAVAFWIIFLFALSSAIGALEIPALTSFMDRVLAYLPNVVAALLILVVAALIAGAVVSVVHKTMGDTPTGKLVQTVVPGLVMAVAVFMILTQLHIAPQIVIITYTALLGMLALTGALAFGLGGREIAAQMWSSAYQKGKDQTGQVRAEGPTATQHTQQNAPHLVDNADGPPAEVVGNGHSTSAPAER